ncbi:MAG: 16S rRNA (uracil(1498)-N(3))-methyltransferase [Lachnospiraceae bacterium]|nr:16S rRNA (uracil(1498)-N(3))-methyltransferase [Lachnospiraceae bacterium]
MKHFFVSGISERDGLVKVTGDDVNHIKNVLRMKVGEELLISDGEGTDYHCRISAFENEEVLCQVLDTETSCSEPNVQFYLFQGLPKADKFEHIIQKSVELGVYEIIPVEMVRSIVKYDAKKQKAKLERWQKIAEGAAKQSRRGIIPEVKAPMNMAKALEYAKENLDLIMIPYENFKNMQSTKELIASIQPGMKVGFFVGPEGGFEPSEVKDAEESGAVQISLGSRILRTETAPLMLLSVLMFQMEK